MQTVAEIPATGNLIARYATFAGLPGYAIRTADCRVFFVDSDAQCTPLGDTDMPALVLLGSVNLAEKQHLLDHLAGGAPRISCTRKQEVQ